MCSATLVDDIHKIFPFCWIYHKLESGKRPKAFLKSSVYETYAINTTKINSHKCVYILNWIRKNVCIVGYSKRRTRMKKNGNKNTVALYIHVSHLNTMKWRKLNKIWENCDEYFYQVCSYIRNVEFVQICSVHSNFGVFLSLYQSQYFFVSFLFWLYIYVYVIWCYPWNFLVRTDGGKRVTFTRMCKRHTSIIDLIKRLRLHVCVCVWLRW